MMGDPRRRSHTTGDFAGSPSQSPSPAAAAGRAKCHAVFYAGSDDTLAVAMLDLHQNLRSVLDEPARAWLDGARERVANEGPLAVAELLPQLPRRLGRTTLGGGRVTVGDGSIDLDAWRACDAGALVLLRRDDAPDAVELDLFAHGDLEERAMVLRCAAVLPVREATVQLLEEVQRTNTVSHVEAGALDSDLLARAHGTGGFDADAFNRLMLKVAFLDLPLHRVFDAEMHANPELSRMLCGLATEREAAGRAVWTDTNWMIAHAPAPGTLARLIGQLEHGDARHRLAAARGLALLRSAEARPFLRERAAREPIEAIERVLRAAGDGEDA